MAHAGSPTAPRSLATISSTSSLLTSTCLGGYSTHVPPPLLGDLHATPPGAPSSGNLSGVWVVPSSCRQPLLREGDTGVGARKREHHAQATAHRGLMLVVTVTSASRSQVGAVGCSRSREA